MLSGIASSVKTIRVFLHLIKFSKPKAAGGAKDPVADLLAVKKTEFDVAIAEKA